MVIGVETSGERGLRSDRDVWIVIPTYNEAPNLPPLVRELANVRDSIDEFNVRVVVIDDGSPDGTGDIAEDISTQHPWLEVVRRAGRLGLASAYTDGFSYALKRGAGVCIQMDCDFSHSPQDLPRMLNALSDENADLIIGSRYVRGGGTVNWSPWRKTISRFGSLYSRTVLRLDVKDLTGGFKCIRSQVLQEIDLTSLDSRGYAINVELTYRAVECGFRVAEIPITFVDRQEGRSKMSLGIVVEAALKVPSLKTSNNRGSIAGLPAVISNPEISEGAEQKGS